MSRPSSDPSPEPERDPQLRLQHERDEERVHTRAEDLLPEERAAGSDDPEAQAAAILADSDERTDDPEGTGAASTQT